MRDFRINRSHPRPATDGEALAEVKARGERREYLWKAALPAPRDGERMDESTMSDDAHTLMMDRFLDRIERLHTAPQVACQVLTVLRDEEFDTRHLVQCLESDPALAASVLRLVNSAYFGLARHIGSLRDAVTYLGSRSLRLAVLSFGLLKQLVTDAPAQLYQDYWRRSLTMAAVSARLADFKPELPSDEAYCAGLLSDIGMLVLAQLETKSYINLYQRVGHFRLLVESEEELYGFTMGRWAPVWSIVGIYRNV